ncbi:DUF4394 domain-containing protein [Phyllobacterium sp. SB3]|uniref:DUF4394 domain-containing protein n=1 Tax=Phyllobacterium sp. SB3 TaxID=3156073 RepID=UPI0032AF636B
MKIVSFLVVAASFGVAGSALAAPAVGLVGDKTLIFFDTDKPEVSKSIDVEGVDKLVGIDFRPGNNTLVGVTPDSGIVTIDPSTGAATKLSAMNKALEIGAAPVIVDFNPMADRLRYMSGTTNHRVNADSGEVTVDGPLAFAEGDMHKGEKPNIVAAAYINSYGKPEKTAMYNIDATIVALIQQAPPNDGQLKAIGKLGIEKPAANYAFDIHTDKDGKNTAWLVNGSNLYTVNLETGAATLSNEIKGASGEPRAIAIMQAM